MTLVRFDKVSLEFGDNPLLIEADLAIEPGERVCLIGRNGAGKTSLLRLITGALPPDHGDLQFRPAPRMPCATRTGCCACSAPIQST